VIKKNLLGIPAQPREMLLTSFLKKNVFQNNPLKGTAKLHFGTNLKIFDVLFVVPLD
jgi:hypothetical protein